MQIQNGLTVCILEKKLQRLQKSNLHYDDCFLAVFVSLRSIIVAELLGIEKLTSSFGLVTMCQGLSAFIGAPIAGKY